MVRANTAEQSGGAAMKRLGAIFGGAIIALCFSATAGADQTSVRGKIVQAQGHVTANCRMVQLRRNDNGGYVWFRIAATGQEDGVLATVLTALTTQLDVDIWYDPAVTSGCGGEPRITWVTLRAANASS